MSLETINVNGAKIGGDETFIIADIGSNHKQDLKIAKESIDAVVEAGANAVKFQSIQLDQLYHYPDLTTSSFIKKLEFPEEWHFVLNDYCEQRNIIFFSSPTYLRAVDLLEEIDVPLYKLASAQIGTFPQIIEKVASLQKPTIFSTGIANYNEIINAVKIFKEQGNEKFIILHCNSIYPTPPERVNLDLMMTYKKMFGNPVGFSDHTIGTHIASAAVAMGAKVIEKHFTLDKSLDTPDSNEFACDPKELKKLVREIRAIEAAKYNSFNRFEIQKEEKDFKNSILYRVVLNKDICKGESFTKKDVIFRRDIKGIDCRDFRKLPDRLIAKHDLKKGELLLNEMLLDSIF